MAKAPDTRDIRRRAENPAGYKRQFTGDVTDYDKEYNMLIRPAPPEVLPGAQRQFEHVAT
jgi:hypothetical protein